MACSAEGAPFPATALELPTVFQPTIVHAAGFCYATTGKPGECKETGHVLILAPDGSRVLALGLGAATSPARDQVAFITATNVQVIDADGSNGRQISSVPRTFFSIPPFLREQSWWSKVVWSPQGDRLRFGTVLDEEFNSNYYLVDVRDGKRRRILSNTSLDVTDWRSMSH